MVDSNETGILNQVGRLFLCGGVYQYIQMVQKSLSFLLLIHVSSQVFHNFLNEIVVSESFLFSVSLTRECVIIRK